MTYYYIMGAIILSGLAASLFFFRKGGIYNPVEADLEPVSTGEPEYSTPTETTPQKPFLSPTEASKLDFSTPSSAFHSTRVICDEMLPLKAVVLVDGKLYMPKDVICAVIYGESEFDNKAVCKNKNAQGVVTSIDVGICQINSYWHTGEGKTFPSTDYVVAHPEEAVRFMVKMYQAGQLYLWIAYKNGRYKQFLAPNSRMWILRNAGALQ